MKKIISFTIWGSDYRYLGGALQNVELAKHFYPGWICRFYLGESTNPDFRSELLTHSNVEVIDMSGQKEDCSATLWRFKAICDPDVEVMIVRDVDSRLHQRDVDVVNEWLNSDKLFHIIRDHNAHNVPIMAGMWGCKKGIVDNIDVAIDAYNAGPTRGVDQNFLMTKIYPRIRDNCIVHDSCCSKESDKPFPSHTKERTQHHFIGQAYDGCGRVLDKRFYFSDFIKEESDITLQTNDKYICEAYHSRKKSL